MKGIDCVQAALTAVAQADSLSDLLYRCVQFCGDVDTVAAIAVAAASTSRHIDRDVPTVLRDGLENGPFGRDHLIALDEKLLRFADLV